MLKRVLAFVALFAFVTSGAMAQSAAVPAVQAKSGNFTVLALMTSDPNWEASWEASKSPAPRLRTTSRVKLGQTAAVAIFFTGAKVDQYGRANLVCEITIKMPNRKTQKMPPAACSTLPVNPAPGSFNLVDVISGVKVEKGDPSGLWVFETKVSDRAARRSVMVRVSVEVDAS